MSDYPIMASSLLFASTDLVEHHIRSREPIPVELLEELHEGLAKVAEHVMALEAVARSVELLGPAEFMGAVRTLPTEQRRGIAAAALARAERRTMPSPRYRLTRTDGSAA